MRSDGSVILPIELTSKSAYTVIIRNMMPELTLTARISHNRCTMDPAARNRLNCRPRWKLFGDRGRALCVAGFGAPDPSPNALV